VWWGYAAVLAGCSPTPQEVADTGITTAPTTLSTFGVDTSAATSATDGFDGGGSSDTTTTTAPDGTTSTDTPGSTDSSSPSSSEGGMQSTGAVPDCHPLLVEVVYDPMGNDNNEQWVKLFNACPAALDLADYSLGWGGVDYTLGTLDLLGTLDPSACFIVGGPNSNNSNALPAIDQTIDLSPNLEKSGTLADGVALFLGAAIDIMVDTVPVDAVIYGESNTSSLLDAQGNTPAPHVGDAGQTESIRRTGPRTWTVEPNPMPELCPPY
jgi:hypothetical protein